MVHFYNHDLLPDERLELVGYLLVMASVRPKPRPFLQSFRTHPLRRMSFDKSLILLTAFALRPFLQSFQPKPVFGGWSAWRCEFSAFRGWRRHIQNGFCDMLVGIDPIVAVGANSSHKQFVWLGKKDRQPSFSFARQLFVRVDTSHRHNILDCLSGWDWQVFFGNSSYK